MLPDNDHLGQTRQWVIHNATGDLEVEARFVGYGTSKSPYHSAHAEGWAAQGMKCQACRWMEIRIFDDGSEFIVAYAGRTDVPKETQRYWYVKVQTEDDLVDLLSGQGNRGRFFSKPARQAVESARQLLPDIGEAYEEHPGHPTRAR